MGCRRLAMEGGLVLVRPPAMYVLGDSTLDVGNNNYLRGADVPRANRRYYGIDFPGRIPTGRFSNGYNTADYVAKSMGFLSSPPPYLALSSSLVARTALATGVNYASADAGILDSTVEYFNTTRAKMVAAVGSAAVEALLAKSIVLMGVGSNDLFVFAASEAARNSDAAALFADLISNYSATITSMMGSSFSARHFFPSSLDEEEELYAMGARKFAIINVGLVGCVPAVRVLDKAGACADGLNQLAAGFDAELRSLLAGLAPKLSGFVYSLADSFGLTQSTFADPQASGYTDIAGACCGSGRLLAEADCFPNATLCSAVSEVRDQHVFWDRYHPAQRACLLTAEAFYDGPAQYTTPINFKQLAQST
ncbi:hypothetical protein HU200_049197 [Digitaria exilis]|uniref:GDSL esterase/lipase n=1 Tax=Digitaria exilis TaxID=1010633 RepID=A0A835AU78_9POAL|nr:hypothetical protein HU200_049197 [Digitaria exilis]